MEKDTKHFLVSYDEPNDSKAKAVVVSLIILLGAAAFLICIYGIVPALLS